MKLCRFEIGGAGHGVADGDEIAQEPDGFVVTDAEAEAAWAS